MSATWGSDWEPPQHGVLKPAPITPIRGGYLPPEDPVKKAYREAQEAIEEDARKHLVEMLQIDRVDRQIQWEQVKLHRYKKQGEALRELHREWQLNQRCIVCGKRFNYSADGTPKPDTAWCNESKVRCHKDDEGDNGLCLRRQTAKHNAEQYRRRKTTQGPKQGHDAAAD